MVLTGQMRKQKFLISKHEDPSLIPRTHVKKTHVVFHTGRDRQTSGPR